MVATIKAVLLHPEARSHALAIDSSHGKLREPIIRLMHLCRAFKLDPIRTYEWIYFKNLEDDIIQSPYESSSVFNFYRPDYSQMELSPSVVYMLQNFKFTTTLVH